ncbi:unnamed protein product [Amoebophrya sp. A25]|nr:unnamed protein product [Amoebophrya sp. A25]|eukprot:GSA25T00006120001.1
MLSCFQNINIMMSRCTFRLFGFALFHLVSEVRQVLSFYYSELDDALLADADAERVQGEDLLLALQQQRDVVATPEVDPLVGDVVGHTSIGGKENEEDATEQAVLASSLADLVSAWRHEFQKMQAEHESGLLEDSETRNDQKHSRRHRVQQHRMLTDIGKSIHRRGERHAGEHRRSRRVRDLQAADHLDDRLEEDSTSFAFNAGEARSGDTAANARGGSRNYTNLVYTPARNIYCFHGETTCPFKNADALKGTRILMSAEKQIYALWSKLRFATVLVVFFLLPMLLICVLAPMRKVASHPTSKFAVGQTAHFVGNFILSVVTCDCMDICDRRHRLRSKADDVTLLEMHEGNPVLATPDKKTQFPLTEEVTEILLHAQRYRQKLRVATQILDESSGAGPLPVVAGGAAGGGSSATDALVQPPRASQAKAGIT